MIGIDLRSPQIFLLQRWGFCVMPNTGVLINENHLIMVLLAFWCHKRALLIMVLLSVSTVSITMVERVLASRLT